MGKVSSSANFSTLPLLGSKAAPRGLRGGGPSPSAGLYKHLQEKNLHQVAEENQNKVRQMRQREEKREQRLSRLNEEKALQMNRLAQQRNSEG